MGEEDKRGKGMDLSQIHQKVRLDIKRDGYSLMSAVGEWRPPITYTIGLQLVRQAEILIHGLEPQQAQPLLHELIHRSRYHKAALVKECFIKDLLASGQRVALLRCDPEVTETHTLMATHIFEEPEYDVLQLVIPDRNDRFPWHHDYLPRRSGQEVQRKGVRRPRNVKWFNRMPAIELKKVPVLAGAPLSTIIH